MDKTYRHAYLLADCLSQPSLEFKNASFSQWPVCTKVANVSCMACTGPQSSRAVLDSMGYSIRTSDWRLTIWLVRSYAYTVSCVVSVLLIY